MEIGPTKTGKERSVELSDQLTVCLAHVQPNVFPIPEETLVFPNLSGNMLQQSNFRNKISSKIVRKALGKGGTLHRTTSDTPGRAFTWQRTRL